MLIKIVRLLCILPFLLLVCTRPIAGERSLATRGYPIKAAFLYNVAKFVKWPAKTFENASSPLILSVIGEDPFGDDLESLKDKKIQGRSLAIRRFTGIKDLELCHILFIGSSEEEHLPEIFSYARRMNILTVSDMKGFAEKGGIINFITSGDKIRFDINIEAANQADLFINSKLLKLAIKIWGKDNMGRDK